MVNKLFPFQKIGIKFLMERKYALLADEMGTGKSCQAIVSARDLREDKILILCPASVKYHWENEINIWDPTASVRIVNGSKWKAVPAKYTIINYDLIHKKAIAVALLKIQYDILICDEAHYLKNARTKRTKMVYSIHGLAERAVRVWLMTGTPVLNRPVEIYPMLRRFMPERLGKFSDYMAFTRKFCGGYQGKWGWDDRGATNIEQLSTYLDSFMLRRLKKDVMKELPDKIYQKILFDAPTREMTELVKKERAEYKKEDMLGSFSTMRQEVGLAKIPLVVEHLENLLEETDKVIVFAYHRKVLEELRRRLKDHNPVLLYGGLSAEQKQKCVDDFVTDRNKRVFLGQIDAAGIGIDGLQKVANTVVFAEISWVPGQIRQAIDRCHRIGQENKVLVQFLMMKGGIDIQIYEGVAHKSKVVKKLVDTPPEIYGRSPDITHLLPAAKLCNDIMRKVVMKMAKRTLEDNIQRIADALEKTADWVVGLKNEPTAPVQAVDPVKPPAEKPAVKAAPVVKAKPAAAAAPKGDAKTLLAYANKKILAITDLEARKATAQAVMAGIKETIGVANIAQVPVDRLDEAKGIIDAAISSGATDVTLG